MKTTVKSKIVAYVVSAILIVFCLFPIYWMLITSLKTSTEIYKIVPTFWPKKLTFEGYYELFAEKGFMKNVLNSLFVSLIVSFGSMQSVCRRHMQLQESNSEEENRYQKESLFLT